MKEAVVLESDTKVTGYSRLQMALHWIVAVLVAFQFLAHDGIEDSWRAYLRSDIPPAGAAALTYLHIASGVLVLLLVVLRIVLRVTRGAPAPPADEPYLLKLVAEAVHGSIYLLLLALPISGAVAWFLGVEIAADAHGLLQTLLLAAIVVHVSGALFQHFIFRSQVLMRMLRPERR